MFESFLGITHITAPYLSNTFDFSQSTLHELDAQATGSRDARMHGGRQGAKAAVRNRCASRGREQVEEVAAVHHVD